MGRGAIGAIRGGFMREICRGLRLRDLVVLVVGDKKNALEVNPGRLV